METHSVFDQFCVCMMPIFIIAYGAWSLYKIKPRPGRMIPPITPFDTTTRDSPTWVWEDDQDFSEEG